MYTEKYGTDLFYFTAVAKRVVKCLGVDKLVAADFNLVFTNSQTPTQG